MSRSQRVPWYLFVATLALSVGRADAQTDAPKAPSAENPSHVYGEWRIRIRPDQGAAYNRLIEQSGLRLFREAGGRMVGWWTTLIGDLYEHVTIWEYDQMAGFERAIGLLGPNPAFAKFVAARDPLLDGEESRFMRLAVGALPPNLPEASPFVIHEVHRVPLARRDAYLQFMIKQAFVQFKAHGFRPVGPWVVDVGRWSEVTYLFRFESLAERERLITAFQASADGKTVSERLSGFVDEITTRVLVPAPFAAKPADAAAPKTTKSEVRLPHREQMAPGIEAAGFADRYRSANCGWVALTNETVLIDLPRGVPAADFLALVRASTGKPARTLVLTHAGPDDITLVRALIEQGIERVLTTPAARSRLLQSQRQGDASRVQGLAQRTAVGDAGVPVDFIPFDDVARDGTGAAAVHVPARSVLFAGPLVVHGPRAVLAGRDTDRWINALRTLEALAPAHVVPGFGTWGGPELLTRQRRFLVELRRQVGYHIAQGRSRTGLAEAVRIPPDYLVWTPYGEPVIADIEHVYEELTVPYAPFNGNAPLSSDRRVHALVLLGDQPHEPGHLEEGLRPVFAALGVVPHFTVDVRALAASNLARVRLLVMLRDGLQRPEPGRHAGSMWMTPDQQGAVTNFVEHGGGFLNLHNSMGLYPSGPYLNLVGGRYEGHGPLERFRVEVVDAAHPVTKGVSDFFVADEQHTPAFDETRGHLLLTSRSDDDKTVAVAGWVREQGRGRVCYLANGHTREALMHPMFQRLLRNAVGWCLRLEAANTGS